MVSSPLAAQEKFEGFYDAASKRFVAKINHGNPSDYKSGYSFEPFSNDGYGIVGKDQDTINGNLFGLIDTSGRVLVPIRYNKIISLGDQNNPGYFIFHTKDSIGLIGAKTGEILKYKTPCKKPDCRDALAMQGLYIFQSGRPGLVEINNRGKIGLYSLAQKRFLIPVEYDQALRSEWPYELYRNKSHAMLIKGDHALCKEQDMYVVFNLNSGEKSGPFKDIQMLCNELFYIEQADGSKIMSRSVEQPKNMCAYEILEIFNWRIIVRKNGRTGVIDTNARVIVPLEYDDIHFHNKSDFWVKKGEYWAMMNEEGALKSGFEFLDIEKLNTVFFTNLLYCTKLDTSGGRYKKMNKPNYDGRADIHNLALKTIYYMDSRITFSAFCSGLPSQPYSFAKKADGYHVIYDTEIKKEAWTNVYYVPHNTHHWLAYQKDKWYGLETTEVRHAGILFDVTDQMGVYNQVLKVDNGGLYAKKRRNTQGLKVGRVGVSEGQLIYSWEKVGTYADFKIR